jgi:hypothetical protein
VHVSEFLIIVIGFTLGPFWLFRAKAVRDHLITSSESHPANKSRLARVSPVVAERLKRAALGWARETWYVTLIRINGAILVLAGILYLGKVLIRTLG